MFGTARGAGKMGTLSGDRRQPMRRNNATPTTKRAAAADDTATSSGAASTTFEPCVAGATISQEREWLHLIRRMALDIDERTTLPGNVRAADFAFLYVREDRTKRQANILRSKARARARAGNANGSSGSHSSSDKKF